MSCLPLTHVSTATLALLSIAKQASTMASEIASHSLSGWPLVTDSEENKISVIPRGGKLTLMN